jgi:UDP-2,3-diacylglucosamine pyrophosphatase LpxH
LKKKVKAVYISDLHLGSKSSHVSELLAFLNSYEFEELYLVGDILDGYKLKYKWSWDIDYNIAIKWLLKLSKKIKIFYIIGNHDDFLEPFINTKIYGLKIKRSCVIKRKAGNILVIHGDQLESHLKISKTAYRLGSRIYEWLLFFNRKLNKIPGINFNFAKYVKTKFKKSMSYILDFERRAANLASTKNCSRVIVGHIHVPEITKYDDAVYYNCGDWVENLSALVEDLDGNIHLVKK